jgi:GPH family glycoside/pentoside/hexuronide:cation symporter
MSTGSHHREAPLQGENSLVEVKPLSLLNIADYNLPMISTGFMFLLVNMYLMKFATDVLLMAPGVIGLIFGLSRLWDAVTDPLVGYWTGFRARR